MLQQMRDKMSGWLTWFFVIVLVLVFALFGLGYYFERNNNQEQVVVEVNDQPITQQQVQVAFDNLRAQMMNQNLSDAQVADLKQEILDQLINEALLYQSAKAMGMGVSDQDIDLMIYQLPAFQEKGTFSPTRYQAILQRMGLTTEAIRQQLATTLMTNQFHSGVQGSSFALPMEVKQQSQLAAQTRNFRFIEISNAHFNPSQTVSPAVAQAYYESHQADFYSKPRVKLAYIELSITDLIKRVHVSPQEVKAYYQSHGKEYLEDFAAEQKKVTAALKREKAQILFGELGDKLANITFENPDSLSYAASELDLPLKTSDWITQAGNHSGIFSNPEVLKAAFSDMVLEEGDNSDVINLTPDHAVVLRVGQYEPSKLQQFSEVKQKIRQILSQQHSVEQAKNLAEEIVLQLNGHHSVEALLKEKHLGWQYKQQVSLDKQSDRLVQTAFHQYVPHQQVSSEATVFTDQDKTYVVQVLAVKLPKVSTMSPERTAVLSTDIAKDWSEYEYGQYLAGLKNTAEIQHQTAAEQ